MRIVVVASVLCIAGCSSPGPSPADAKTPRDERKRGDPSPAADEGEPDPSPAPANADVVAVRTRQVDEGYRFLVTVRSPDTGCDRYANWWEVLGQDGSLLFRRILMHSHVDDQPFERRGGPVDIDPDTRVFVRAHMHPGGYGGRVMVGTPAAGFEEATDVDPGFAAAVEKHDPQPDRCRH